MAEREGFEPPEPCGSAVFKTAAIDHSATSPCCVAGDKFCEMANLSSFLFFFGQSSFSFQIPLVLLLIGHSEHGLSQPASKTVVVLELLK